MASYKRTTYLINPKFQIKFSLFVTSLVFISSLIYPIMILETYNNLIRSAKSEALAKSLMISRSDLIELLIAFQLIFTALVFVICIFQSHKIAGPLYKLKKYLQDLREGNSHNKLVFRKGDNFKELADEYNLAIDTINRTIYERTQKLDQLDQYISEKLSEAKEGEKEMLNDLLKKVSEIKSHKAS